MSGSSMITQLCPTQVWYRRRGEVVRERFSGRERGSRVHVGEGRRVVRGRGTAGGGVQLEGEG